MTLFGRSAVRSAAGAATGTERGRSPSAAPSPPAGRPDLSKVKPQATRCDRGPVALQRLRKLRRWTRI